MNSTSLIHGSIAGWTAAYLKEPDNKRPLMQLTLQANHLLLLTAETIRFAGSPLGTFGTVVKLACALTPAAAMIADHTSKKDLISQERLNQISTIYQTGVIIASLATLALGNPVFAVASLSVLALDALGTDNNEYIRTIAKRVGACLALIGYGAQALAAEGVLAGLTALNAALIGLNFLPKGDFSPPLYLNNYSNTDWEAYDSYKHRPEENEYVGPSLASSNNSSSSFLSQIGRSLCRQSVFA